MPNGPVSTRRPVAIGLLYPYDSMKQKLSKPSNNARGTKPKLQRRRKLKKRRGESKNGVSARNSEGKLQNCSRQRRPSATPKQR